MQFFSQMFPVYNGHNNALHLYCLEKNEVTSWLEIVESDSPANKLHPAFTILINVLRNSNLKNSVSFLNV